MDDHVNMISASGEKRALPCSQIIHWSRQKLFSLETGESKVGWTYADLEKGKKSMAAWEAYQNDLAIQRKLSSEAPVERDGGAATAHLHKSPAIVPPQGGTAEPSAAPAPAKAATDPAIEIRDDLEELGKPPAPKPGTVPTPATVEIIEGLGGQR